MNKLFLKSRAKLLASSAMVTLVLLMIIVTFIPATETDLWEHPGFHCGDCMEVLVDGEWVPTRIEMDSGLWYLVDTPYKGDLEYVRARILD